MTPASCRLSLWAPRALALLFAAFLGLFALDVFAEGRTPAATLVAFAVHLTPTWTLLLIVTLAWKREWVGALASLGVAAAYAAAVLPRHPAWALVISGPLVLLSALYLWSWRHHDELRAAR